jgi:hypothetical protein
MEEEGGEGVEGAASTAAIVKEGKEKIQSNPEKQRIQILERERAVSTRRQLGTMKLSGNSSMAAAVMRSSRDARWCCRGSRSADSDTARKH